MPRIVLLLVLACASSVVALGAAAIEFSLYAAAKAGDIEQVRRLIADGAEVDLPDRFDAPLHAAAARGDVEIVRLLIDAGADINLTGFLGTPLHVAASTGKAPVVELLVAEGAAVDAVNAYGSTPLHLAAGNGHADAATALLAAGADVDGRPAPYIPAPILAAAHAQHADVVRVFAGAGADLGATDLRCGMTVLHHAVEQRDRQLVEDLLAAGADPAQPTPEGETPMMLAEKSGDAALIQLFRAPPAGE